MGQRDKEIRKQQKPSCNHHFVMAFVILKHVISEINRFYELIFLQRLFASYLAIPSPSVQEYKIYFDM